MNFDLEKRARSDLQRVEYETTLAEDRLQILIEYQDAFLRLLAGGVVGQEARLSWIETLKKKTLQHRIPRIRYRIDSRMPTSPEALGYTPEASEPVSIYRTRMELDMDLLHEAEVVIMLGALKREAEGLFTIDQCDLVRVSEQLSWDLSTNFRGICTLQWHTIKRPDPNQEVLL
jgi:hypothetical protein